MVDISVIIPTHNRAAMLRSLLNKLDAQRDGTPAFEVLVVADGCEDDTSTMLSSLHTRFPLRTLTLPGVGPALARNAGSQVASGRLLIFLDDDIEPGENFVWAHVVEHQRHPGGVVMGPYPPLPHIAQDRFRLSARAWWTRHFERVSRPGHQFAFTDVLTGNLSLDAELFHAMGGLDPQFARAREDFEFGLRLIKKGVPIRFAPDALGYHLEHQTTTLTGKMVRRHHEGRSDALMARKHPDIQRLLAIHRFAGRKGRKRRLQRTIATRAGSVLDPLVKAGPPVLQMLEKVGLRRLYDKVERQCSGYHYLRGAAEVLGEDWRLPTDPTASTDEIDVLEINLDQGLEAAEAILAERRPLAARIMNGTIHVGDMCHRIGAEPWDARHFRPWLNRQAIHRYLPVALAEWQGQPINVPSHLSDFTLNGLNNPSFHAHMIEQHVQWMQAKLRSALYDNTSKS
ncbi:glycosyltransferase family 2 protein [Rhizobium leguminosarum]|uniref:glycosyltransferase family 2 protein n=1 Tax=Rhizobium leguminosarum TaxID=384 RepID=UPI0013DD1D4C|nr:glycosyltransferase [Rhizobium leguminosarum]NEK35960.1 glycosyltransferase [Rhizobium leguminosarum]